jgi:hypothetical protein
MDVKEKNEPSTRGTQQTIENPTVHQIESGNAAGPEQTIDIDLGQETREGNTQEDNRSPPTLEMASARDRVLSAGRKGNHFQTLDLDLKAFALLNDKEKEETVKKAWKKILKLVHPDKWPKDEAEKSNEATRCKFTNYSKRHLY